MKKAARVYGELLKETEVVLPSLPARGTHVFHLYVIKTKKRDELQDYLKQAGISTGSHYPVPLHLQPSLKELGYREGDFPVAEATAKEILSLPMFPQIKQEQIEYVARKINEFFGKS